MYLARDGHAEAAVAASEAALEPDPLGRVPAAGRRDAVRARLGARLDDLGWDADQAGRELAARSREDVDPRSRKVERRGCQARLERLVRRKEGGGYEERWAARSATDDGCVRVGTGKRRTTGRAADEDAADAFVDTAEAAGLDEAGLRLESRLERVDREEKEVDRQAGKGAALSQRRSSSSAQGQAARSSRRRTYDQCLRERRRALGRLERGGFGRHAVKKGWRSRSVLGSGLGGRRVSGSEDG